MQQVPGTSEVPGTLVSTLPHPIFSISFMGQYFTLPQGERLTR